MTGMRVTAVLIGTAAAFVASACGPRHVITPAPVSRSLVVLLADPDSGALGRATVSNQSGSVDLVGERDSTDVAMNQSPPAARTFAEAEIQRMFGEALTALPPSPERFILQFQFDSDELTAEGRKLVLEIIRSVGQRSVPEVDVVGHTDTTGTSQGNFELGMKRAVTVRELLRKAGLDASLIDVQSHGESDPLVRTADNTSEPRNRRVEVAVR
jgi:outer membrane protein OmpA-like peptidoglycan-associated protein